MRKVGEESPPVNLSKKIKVELTIHELMLLAAAEGKSRHADTNEYFNEKYRTYGGTDLTPGEHDISLYQAILAILESEGIKGANR